MNKLILTILTVTLLTTGCATTTKTPGPATNEGGFVRVFPVMKANELNLGLSEIQRTRHEKSNMQEVCGFPREAAPEGVLAALGSMLVGSGIRLALDAIDKDLKEALEEYSKSYSASYGGTLSERNPCWRVTRGRYIVPAGGAASEKIDFDATIALIPDVNATEVVPLRLVFTKPAPVKKSSNNQYGVAMAINVDAGTDEGMETAFDTVIIKDNITYDGNTVVRYYGDSNVLCEKSSEDLPIYCGKLNSTRFVGAVPVSNPMQMTATVSETGAPSDFLKFASKLFGTAKGDIGDALAEAAAAKINPE